MRRRLGYQIQGRSNDILNKIVSICQVDEVLEGGQDAIHDQWLFD
jgi:hypothetical protein